MDETRIPGELEGVIVRMPMKITHAPIVNFFIACAVSKAAKAVEELSNKKNISKKRERVLKSRIEKARIDLDKYEPISIVDKVMSHLMHIKASKTVLANYSRFLISKNFSIQCNKVALAFLGTFGTGRDIEQVKKFATNEEYTFFVVKALGSLIKNEEDYVDSLIDIASNTFGWGKIAAVIDLPDNINKAENRYFLLQSGTSNTIGKHFLAVECAIKGKLDDFLCNAIDKNVILERDISDGICDIFKGLFEAIDIKDADSFDEVPNIEQIINNFCILYENGLIDSPLSKEIYTKLTSRK